MAIYFYIRQSFSNAEYVRPCAAFQSLQDRLPSEPGGYIQWDESDFGGIRLDSPKQEIPHTALDELKAKVHDVLMKTKGTNFR